MSLDPKPNGRPIWKPIGVLVTLIGIGLLIYTSATGGRHSVDPESLKKNAHKMISKPIKIEGKVVAGSFKPNPKDSLDFRFSIRGKGGATFAVHHRGVLPDPFAENRHVIITGVLTSKTLITSKRVIVKCPSRYEEQKHSPDDLKRYRKKLRAADAT